jgi:hypothetical protein
MVELRPMPSIFEAVGIEAKRGSGPASDVDLRIGVLSYFDVPRMPEAFILRRYRSAFAGLSVVRRQNSQPHFCAQPSPANFRLATLLTARQSGQIQPLIFWQIFADPGNELTFRLILMPVIVWKTGAHGPCNLSGCLRVFPNGLGYLFPVRARMSFDDFAARARLCGFFFRCFRRLQHVGVIGHGQAMNLPQGRRA